MIENDLSETLSLEGIWDFKLGKEIHWGKIEIPSCWEAAGYSKFVDGPAIFKRNINIPESWAGQTILLEFDAVSYACEIKFNDQHIATHHGMWTPFAVDVTAACRTGADNNLEILVYKPGDYYPMRSTLAGFLPDVATTFGGIWQPVRIKAVNFGLENLRVDADLPTKSLNISGKVVCNKNLEVVDGWEVIVSHEKKVLEHGFFPIDQALGLAINISVPEVVPWEPLNPILYDVQLDLLAKNEPLIQTTKRVGFRSLETDGDQLLLNHNPIILRGILSWGWEPDRISPAYTEDQVRKEIHRAREMGFNLIKLCLFVPNQTYYQVADEQGMLLWQEWPLWQPEMTTELREIMPREYSELVKLTHHHPSIVIHSLGCELNQSIDEALLGELDRVVRKQTTGVLVCDNSGSGESYGGLDIDFSDFTDYHPYYDLHYLESLLDNWRRDWQSPRPWIFGEFCDSDTLRDIGEIIRYNGGQKPWWLTTDNPVTRWRSESKAMLEVQERLSNAQLDFSTHELIQTSYAQSLIERKYTLELLRCRKGIRGYVITGLRDTPISTSGIWDDFLRSKWDPREFRKVNDNAILCIDVTRRRRWHYGGDRPDRLDVYNHWSGSSITWFVIFNSTGRDISSDCLVTWSLTDPRQNLYRKGRFEASPAFVPGNPYEIGLIYCQLPDVEIPTELKLQITVEGAGETITNSWSIWVYPRITGIPEGVGILDPVSIMNEWGGWLNHIPRIMIGSDLSGFDIILTTIWTSELEVYVNNGGKIILIQQGDGPLPARRCPFWRESVVLFHQNSIWNGFNRPFNADMRFFGVASDRAFVSQELADAFPDGATINPIMRRLDAREFHVSDYLIEASIGKGILLGCSLQLQGGVGAQPYGFERNVVGSWLLWIMLSYLGNIQVV